MKDLSSDDEPVTHTNGNVKDACDLIPGSMSEPLTEVRVNDYTGYEPPPGCIQKLERISATINPEEFYQKYVLQRKPVVLSGPPSDSRWKGHRWTNKYLADEAGRAEIIVEQRGTTKDATFGLLAPKINMTYGEFVKNIMNGNDRLYMTTQDLERFEDDLDDFEMPKSVFAEPLHCLSDDFPTNLNLLGNLVPYQLSMWHGLATNGSSSGLHHDYHDNLYILLRGRKRFRLFAPSVVKHMKTAGIPAKVHSNGLLVYRNKPHDPTVVVRSDGVPLSFLVRLRKDKAETELLEAEEALENLLASEQVDEEKEAERKKLEERLEECEAEIDSAMEDMLLYGCPGTDHVEVYSDSDDEPEAKKCKPDNDDSGHECDTEDPLSVKMPDHFCDMSFPVDSDDPNVVFTSNPHLKEVGCMICEIKAGDMLYLPASWFHEVTSYSDENDTKQEENQESVKCSNDRGHLAFNYWLYPPDGNSFTQPYKDDFWPKRWEKIKDGPPPPIQKIWSSDDEEEEGDGEEEEEEEEEGLVGY